MKYKVCESCVKDSDTINAKVIASDKSTIGPSIIPGVPMECDRCNNEFAANEKIILIKNEA